MTGGCLSGSERISDTRRAESQGQVGDCRFGLRLVYSRPAFAHHSPLVTRHLPLVTAFDSSRYSHAFALFHSRITVMGASPRTSAVSSTLRPPK